MLEIYSILLIIVQTIWSMYLLPVTRKISFSWASPPFFTQPKNPLRHLHMLLFFFVEFIRQISCLATFKTLTHHEPVIRILSSLIHWFSSHQLLGCLYLCLWLEKSGHMYCYTWLFFCLRSIPRTFSCILLGANFVQFFHSFSMNNSIN